MVQCSLCSKIFPLLEDVVTCTKCNKMKNATAGDRRIIAQVPQCNGCGVVYEFLDNQLCGACEEKADEDPKQFENGGAALKTYIATRMEHHGKTVSKLRLNQARPQPPALANAAAVKEKISQLKKQKKAESATVNCTLYLYPKGNGAAKKVQTTTLHLMALSTDCTDTVLDNILKKAELAYDNIPNKASYRPNFTREETAFSIDGAGTNLAATLIDDKHLSCTLDELFAILKKERRIAEKAESQKCLPLRLALYEPQEYIEVSDDEPEAAVSAGIKRRRHEGSMAKASSMRADVLRASARVQPSKRRASGSVLAIQDSSSISGSRTSQPKKPYTSKYRPNEMLISFKPFPFTRRTAIVQENGKVEFVISKTVEVIEVAQDWQIHKKAQARKGGYLSYGLSKYAFQGRLGGEEVALFQNKIIGSSQNSNRDDLICELRVISLAQYFLNSFYERATSYDIKLPVIKWNIPFFGTVSDSDMLDMGHDSDETRCLLWPDFLAAPLLKIDAPGSSGHQEVRFSGNDCVANNEDILGRIIDAYVHHTAVDSHGAFLVADIQGVLSPDGVLSLFDPQAHTSQSDIAKRLGFWDSGPDQIREYLQKHICNSVCRSISLHKEPLVIGGVDETPRKKLLLP